MRKLYSAVGLSMMLVLVSATLTLAWPGGAPAKVIIGGPGLKGQVEVTDRALLEGLGTEQLVNFEQRLSPTPQLGTGFKLTRYMGAGGEVFVDHLTYYPHPGAGRGVVLYQGSESGGGEAFKGYYFYATRQGNDAMRRLIQNLGGSLSESQASADSASLQLDAVPNPIVAGRKVTLGFTVKHPQQAQALADTLTVYANEGGGASSTVFSARADDAPGHYTLPMELPRGGLWYLSVDLGPLNGRQELTSLKVLESGGTATTSNSPAAASGNDTSSMSWLWLTAAAVLALGAVGGMGFWLGRRGARRST